MKHHFFLLTLVISPVLAAQAAKPIVFRGDSLIPMSCKPSKRSAV